MPVVLHHGSSLESWLARIRNQLQEVLNPTERFSEITPTEALEISLDLDVNWTLIALANVARDDELAAIRMLALSSIRQFAVRDVDDYDGAKLWDVLPVRTQTTIQQALLECFQIERDQDSSREANTLCRTCSYLLELNGAAGHPWPELDETLRNLLQPKSSLQKQRLFYTFIAEYPNVIADMELPTLRRCLRHGLSVENDKSTELVAEAIKAAVAVLNLDDRWMELKDIIPEMLHVFPTLHARKASSDLSKSLYCLVELYDSQASSLLSPYLPQFIPFVSSLLPSTTLDFLRQSAIEFLTSTAEYQPQIITSSSSASSSSSTLTQSCLQLYEEIITNLIHTMTEMRNDETSLADFWKSDVDDEDLECEEMYAGAEDALNRIALAIGAKHVLPAAFRIIPQMLSSDDWRKRYAALSAIGTLAESSVQEYRGDIGQMMQMVLDGLADPNPRIVYAAVYAAAELCSYLEGAVQEGYDEPLLSALFRIFSTPFAPGRLVAYACAALVNFTSDLSMATPPALLVHGPAILEQLLRLVSSEHSREDVRLKAMSATAQTASVMAEQGKLTQEMLTASLETFWPFMSSGEVEETLKARAVDCATLVASSAEKSLLEPHVQKLVVTLVHIQQTHNDADDPCTMQVLTGLVRIAGVLEQDFLPHVDSVIPQLLRIANTQVDQPYEARLEMDANDENNGGDDDENYVVHSEATGSIVKINSASLQEKAQAVELLTALAHSLGVGLTETGDSQATTGDWMSYAETMINLAATLVAYEHSSEIRQAAAAMLPALIRAFNVSMKFPRSFNWSRMMTVVKPLLAAMSYETDPDVLTAQFAATSEIVLAVPDLFSPEDASTFVNTCREQIEELKRVMQAARDAKDEASLADYPPAIRAALELMSSSLQAFIKTAGAAFPVQRLFKTIHQALGEQLSLEGEKEWALRLICDLVQYASPSAVAWTSGLLPSVVDGLSDLKPIVRQISAFAVGIAAMNAEGLYKSFCQACVEPLCRGVAVQHSRQNEDEALAHDNFVSALGKIIVFSSILEVDADRLLPIWLKGLPIIADVEEMEPTYGLLLDIVAREHPYVAPEQEEARDLVLHAFAAALANPKLPPQMHEHLSVGFRNYLSRAPLETQHVWKERLTKKVG